MNTFECPSGTQSLRPTKLGKVKARKLKTLSKNYTTQSFNTNACPAMSRSIKQTAVESWWTRSLAPTSWYTVSTSVIIRLILVTSQHQICSARYSVSNRLATTSDLTTLHTYCRLLLFTADLPFFCLK